MRMAARRSGARRIRNSERWIALALVAIAILCLVIIERPVAGPRICAAEKNILAFGTPFISSAISITIMTSGPDVGAEAAAVTSSPGSAGLYCRAAEFKRDGIDMECKVFLDRHVVNATYTISSCKDCSIELAYNMNFDDLSSVGALTYKHHAQEYTGVDESNFYVGFGWQLSDSISIPPWALGLRFKDLSGYTNFNYRLDIQVNNQLIAAITQPEWDGIIVPGSLAALDPISRFSFLFTPTGPGNGSLKATAFTIIEPDCYSALSYTLVSDRNGNGLVEPGDIMEFSLSVNCPRVPNLNSTLVDYRNDFGYPLRYIGGSLSTRRGEVLCGDDPSDTGIDIRNIELDFDSTTVDLFTYRAQVMWPNRYLWLPVVTSHEERANLTRSVPWPIYQASVTFSINPASVSAYIDIPAKLCEGGKIFAATVVVETNTPLEAGEAELTVDIPAASFYHCEVYPLYTFSSTGAVLSGNNWGDTSVIAVNLTTPLNGIGQPQASVYMLVKEDETFTYRTHEEGYISLNASIVPSFATPFCAFRDEWILPRLALHNNVRILVDVDRNTRLGPGDQMQFKMAGSISSCASRDLQLSVPSDYFWPSQWFTLMPGTVSATSGSIVKGSNPGDKEVLVTNFDPTITEPSGGWLTFNARVKWPILERSVVVNPPPRTLGLNVKVKHALRNNDASNKASLPFLLSEGVLPCLEIKADTPRTPAELDAYKQAVANFDRPWRKIDDSYLGLVARRIACINQLGFSLEFEKELSYEYNHKQFLLDHLDHTLLAGMTCPELTGIAILEAAGDAGRVLKKWRLDVTRDKLIWNQEYNIAGLGVAQEGNGPNVHFYIILLRVSQGHC